MLNTNIYKREKNIHTWAAEVDYDRMLLLGILQRIQEKDHYLTEKAIRSVANEFGLQPAEILGLTSFFSTFETTPNGKFAFKLCEGISCDLQQKEDLQTYIQEKLSCKFGQTSPDGMFSLKSSPCLGMCDQGPVLMVNNHIFPKITIETFDAIISLCEMSQNSLHSQFDWGAPTFWEGRSEISSFQPIIPGSVIKTLDTRSISSLLQNMVDNRIISAKNYSLIDPKTRGQVAHPLVVCNTDLSQSGSFKERLLLSDHYDLFIEGMIALTYISGADEGIIFLRPEYSSLQVPLSAYLDRLKNNSESLNSNTDQISCSIDIRMSPGFPAGGMERALYTAIHSNRYCATSNPPSTQFIIPIDAETVIRIANYLLHTKSPQISSNVGRIFAISGNCSRPGLYEISDQFTIHNLLALSGGEDAVAIQMGGILGKFIHRSNFDSIVGNETPKTSTSIIVYGPDTNFREIGIKLLQYYQSESCGQCTPCREGPSKILEKFMNIRKDRRSRYSLSDMNSISECMQEGSRCEFGQLATIGFQSLIQCFPELLLTIHY